MRAKDVLSTVLTFVLLMSAAYAQTPTPDETVEAARQAARDDRHEEAITSFEDAIAAAPDRRNGLLLELADQLTWAGRLDEAVALYREAVQAAPPDQQVWARIGLARALAWKGAHDQAIAEYDAILRLQPSQREASLGRAQALSWDGRHGAAIAQYEAVLREQPNELEAERGIGRVLSWAGRHRQAAGRMQTLLQSHPQDREATIILAESLAWMGRRDRALEVLQSHLALDPGHDRAQAMMADLRRGFGPEARIDVRVFDRSDNLGVEELALGFDIPLADGRGGIGPRYRRAIYSPPQGALDEISVDRAGLAGRYRFSDAVELHAAAFVDRIEADGVEHAPVTYDAYLTYWPHDQWRLDMSASRWTFDSEEALVAGLTAREAGVAVSFAPNDVTSLAVRASTARYSDGNERVWWQFQADRRVWRDPNVTLSYRYTGFDFESPGQRGYYNPDRQHTNEVMVHAYGPLSETLWWDVRAAVGQEVEKPGGSRTIGAASVGLNWTLDEATTLEFGYDYSTSRAADPNGFARGIGSVTLRRRF
jgi:tetratricopeptide (TPR) repeat protein